MYHPAHSLILNPVRPIVKLTDVRDDIADATAYTFTGVNIGPIRPRANPAQSIGTDQVMRSVSNKAIMIVCHSEAAAITWTVSTCSLGGVNGSKLVDRGGGTIALNTAIFIWPADVLQAITTTDVVVTHSKAVTACAIGVLSVENMMFTRTGAFGTTFGTSAAAAAAHAGSGSCTLAEANLGFTMIAGSTCDTGAGAEVPQFTRRTDGTSIFSGFDPILLYEGSNAEISFAAAMVQTPAYNANLITGGYNIDWNGAGAFDSAACSIY